jgi:hypothetical protein
MKTKKLLQILFATAALTFLGFSLTTTAHAKMHANAKCSKKQTGTYLGYFYQTVNGGNTQFYVYGDPSTNDITDIYDETDGIDCTLNGPYWRYETSPLEIIKVEFSLTAGDGVVFHLIAENCPLYNN